MKKQKMTIEELNKIIIDNFTDKFGVVNINGLKFDCDVNISRMEVKGFLCQDNQKVDGNLYQDSQKVKGDLIQSNQEVSRDLYQRVQKVNGRIFNQKS